MHVLHICSKHYLMQYHSHSCILCAYHYTADILQILLAAWQKSNTIILIYMLYIVMKLSVNLQKFTKIFAVVTCILVWVWLHPSQLLGWPQCSALNLSKGEMFIDSQSLILGINRLTRICMGFGLLCLCPFHSRIIINL